MCNENKSGSEGWHEDFELESRRQLSGQAGEEALYQAEKRMSRAKWGKWCGPPPPEYDLPSLEELERLSHPEQPRATQLVFVW